MEDWEIQYLEKLKKASEAIKDAQEILVENGLDVRQPKIKGSLKNRG
ncbi:hypothetical protein [Desulfofustis limnaeus]|uniref:Uncharacterized protein n=1 Tax=Desulfofustis limnaeus TaxID=2740163 RepID=A0ABM7W837_9BACT|nr:hypothetical protein [Desulfofustis limnaeus]BDD87028.1 hypothetical protein DPPLL_13930 [Desulfofustis limnaeus]